ncbi:MAG: DUF6428 family protein [Bacteroidota bacterium]|jgi:hypothetical protein
MKLSFFKKCLSSVQHLQFRLDSGLAIPDHVHVTEVGIINKQFVDCGGVIRKEHVVSFQLWYADDLDHRLKPHKLIDIISISEKLIGLEDLDVEVEYQRETIGRYHLAFDGTAFILIAKHTACLAEDACGTGIIKQKIKRTELATVGCKPGSGCC